MTEQRSDTFPQWLIDATPKDGKYHNLRHERTYGVERWWIGDMEVFPPRKPDEEAIHPLGVGDWAITMDLRVRRDPEGD